MTSVADPIHPPSSDQRPFHINLAQILANRRTSSPSALFKQYSVLLHNSNSSDQIEQSRLYLLLSKLTDDKSGTIPAFSRLTLKIPLLKSHIRFFEWLCELHQSTVPDPADSVEQRAFHCLRSWDPDGFFHAVSSLVEDWKALTFAGAFSFEHYKQWEAAAAEHIHGAISDQERDLYLLLSGDRDICEKYSRTFEDRVWSEIFHLSCAARAGNSVSLDRANFPHPTTVYERTALSILTKGVQSIVEVTDLPLEFGVHVTAAVSSPPDSLLKPYVDVLAGEGLLGWVVFYASLAAGDTGIDILADVFAGLKEPDEKPLELAQRIGFSPGQLAEKIVERIMHLTVNDVEGDATPEELAERKVAAVDWIALVPKAERFPKVYETIQRLVLNSEFDTASHLFERHRTAFALPEKAREKQCWDMLFQVEALYKDWLGDKSVGKDLQEGLKAILRFPKGWMKECPGVSEAIGKHCVRLVARQLHEVMMEAKNFDGALGIAAMICDSGNLLERYFDRDELKTFLVDLMKPTAIASLTRRASESD
jgi:hypothetical protein